MTLDNGWFLHEVSILGSIETGKLDDIIVLSADYSNPEKVSDEDIKKLKPVLTVVDGKIVYDEMK